MRRRVAAFLRAHILIKLRLRDQVQAVVFAYENGVVAPGDPG